MRENIPDGINPQQLELSLVARDLVMRTPEGYTNTVELFDSVLKFSSSRVRKVAEREERIITFRGQDYRVGISPAIIKGVGGKTQIIMPGQREDLVEKALRKIAAESAEAWKVTEDEPGHVEIQIGFTLYQIRKLLAETGHDFKTSEIEQALQVLQGARIEIETQKGDLVGGVRSGIFQTYIYSKHKKGDKDGKESRGWVKFHPLVTASIIAKNYRRIDFRKLMALKVDLARWLYQRMSHVYTQASIEDTYNAEKGYSLSLDTILRESGMERRERMRDNVRAVRRALDELVAGDVLHAFRENLQFIKDPNKFGPKQIAGAVWILKPSTKIIDDVVTQNQANKAERDRRPSR